jgi:hypothetical protein
MQVGKPIVILLVILVMFSGCTFLRHTKFTLQSYAVSDDNGFSQLVVSFNTSDTVTITVINPENTTVFSKSFFYGPHTEHISLAGYRVNPIPGSYLLRVTDASKNTVYQKSFLFNASVLSFLKLSEDWWKQDSQVSLVGVSCHVRNTGDVPLYLSSMIVSCESQSFESHLIPEVILPGRAKELHCFVLLNDLSDEPHNLSVCLADKNGTILAQIYNMVTPQDYISPWEYTWKYEGYNTVSLPGLDWFSTYYSSIKRFDILDYAVYVFDPYDDAAVSFAAHQLLSLTSASSDVDRVNFVSSFVHGLEYAKDDPANESYEYPRFPLETFHDRHGDCEDKAILTAALLHSIGYNVSLIRLPEHMAVGVHLNETLPGYSYYSDQYYYLEATSLHMPLGQVPSEYQGLTNITIYPVSSRPLLLHHWRNATLFEISTGVKYVDVQILLENLGQGDASLIEIRAGFFNNQNESFNQKSTIIPLIPAGEK